MSTTLLSKPTDPARLRICNSRLIIISPSVSSSVLILKTWLGKYSSQRVQCYVLDVSPSGEVEKAVEKMRMPDAARHDFKIWRAPSGDDEATCKELQRFMLSDDAAVQVNEVILGLHPRAFPEIVAACLQLASKWFYGRSSRDTSEGWAFDVLSEFKPASDSADLQLDRRENRVSKEPSPTTGVTLMDFRDCVVSRHYPRRPNMLLIASPHQSAAFLSSVSQLPSSWLSFAQLVDSSEGIEECWKCPEPPDLVFTDLHLCKDLIAQRRWGSYALVVASEDRGVAARSFFKVDEVDAKTRTKFPEVVVSWFPELAGRVVPLWLTRPLRRSAHSLPSISYYQQTPELQQIRDLWQTGTPTVVTLVGYGGTGKTALAQRFLEECTQTGNENRSVGSESGMVTSDATFVWDFYAEPFSEKFLKSFASYLDPDDAGDTSIRDCVRLIRQRINQRNLRRVLLVLDGLEMIQQLRSGSAEEGDLQDQNVLELLTEIVFGGLPIIALLTTRLAPVELTKHADDGYVQIQMGKMQPATACELLRLCGDLKDDGNLAILAERFGYHAMTLYHLGRLLGDFYHGNTRAAVRLPAVEEIFQHSDVEEIDELNRCFIQVFARYEEHLPEQELAVLTRMAVVGEPLSVSEFAQIFAGSEESHVAGPLAGLPLDEVQTRFDMLHERQLLNVHVELDRANRYATHPALTYYFANALAADAEPLRLGARNYYERRLDILEGADQSSTHVRVRTHGAVRSRGAAIGPRGSRVNYPTNPVILDLLERIISHTIRSGRVDEARFYYQRRMGGDEHLKGISEHARARRISTWLERPMPK